MKTGIIDGAVHEKSLRHIRFVRVQIDKPQGADTAMQPLTLTAPLAREQNCRMQEEHNVLSQAAMRQGRLAGFLLILNVICVVLSLMNLQAQEKEHGTSPPGSPCGVEILTPTGDVDFRDYMAHVCGDVNRE